MASLFISYSRKNIEAARKLSEAFKGQDLDFWIDWEGIPPTVDWWKQIEKGIEEADIFFFLISPDACKSKVCKREIGHAIKNGKRLIPLVVCDVKGVEAPAELSHLNWIFIRETDDLDLAFANLITAIRTDYAWAQAHRELQVKALDWEKSGHENSFLLFGKELQDAEFQLATNTSKEPYPTDLQREYVHKSRQAVDRRRVRNASFSVVAVIALAALAVFGFVQAGLARNAEATAIANASVAQTAQADAEERARIARSGELAAQSLALRESQLDLSLLLGVEAFRKYDNGQTRTVLMDNVRANPMLYQFIEAHSGSIFSVGYSPDGSLLASSGWDGTINLWDVTGSHPVLKGKPLKLNELVRAIAFSPNSQILASGGNDQTVVLWDVTTGKPVAAPLRGHSHFVFSLAFSPDGRILASGSRDGSIILWDLTKSQPVEIGELLTGHADIVTSIAFSSDSTRLISSANGTISLWDLRSRPPASQIVSGMEAPAEKVAFAPNGRLIASSHTDGSIVLWDAAVSPPVPIGQPLQRGSPEEVNRTVSLAFSPDSSVLASGNIYGSITIWDLMTSPPKPVGEPLGASNASVESLSFHPDEMRLASGYYDGNVVIWNLGDSPWTQVGERLESGFGMIKSLAFSPDGLTLASGHYDGPVLLWDLTASSPSYRMLGGLARSLAFSHDGTKLATVSWNDSAKLWDLTAFPLSPEPYQALESPGESLAFRPDGSILAIGGGDGSIVVWNLAGELEIPRSQTIHQHTEQVTSIDFSPDGGMMASGSWDGTVILWEISGSSVDFKEQLSAHAGRVTGVAFSPDGSTLASGSYDKSILQWNVRRSPTELASRLVMTDYVTSLAFSPDGAILAAGSVDNTISLWQMTKSTFTRQLIRGHSNYVVDVAFSPDGHYLASGSYDGTVVVWEVQVQTWLDQACQRAGRNLTPGEWAEYFPGEEYHLTCSEWGPEPDPLPPPTPIL